MMPPKHARWISKIWYSDRNHQASQPAIRKELAAEGLWSAHLEHECFKATCILRSVCKGETFKDSLRDKAGRLNHNPKDASNIDPQIIQKAKALVVCSVLRAGLWEDGAGGSGIAVVRQQDGSWSCPAAIRVATPEIGVMVGVDIYDMVLVINSDQCVEALKRGRFMVGGSHYAAAGPLSVGFFLEANEKALKAPIWSYIRYNNYYADALLDHTAIFDRDQENERFYSPQKLSMGDILNGVVRSPPADINAFMQMLRIAQGEDLDTAFIPTKKPPSDFHVVEEGRTFGVPDPEDPDPFGLRALQNQGIMAREANTGKTASPESFEFSPRIESPVHDNYYRRARGDNGSIKSGRTTWRRSAHLGSLDGTSLPSPGAGQSSFGFSGSAPNSPRESIRSHFTTRSDAISSTTLGLDSPASPSRENVSPRPLDYIGEEQESHDSEKSENDRAAQFHSDQRPDMMSNGSHIGVERPKLLGKSSGLSISELPPRISEEIDGRSSGEYQLSRADTVVEAKPEGDQTEQSHKDEVEGLVSQNHIADAKLDMNGEAESPKVSGIKETNDSITEIETPNNTHDNERDHSDKNDEDEEDKEQDKEQDNKDDKEDDEDITSDLDSDVEFEDLDDDDGDEDEEAEIVDASNHFRASTTAHEPVAMTITKPKVVSVAKASTPALPSRNPGRVRSTHLGSGDLTPPVSVHDDVQPVDKSASLDDQAEHMPGGFVKYNESRASSPDKFDDALDLPKLPERRVDGPKISNMMLSLRPSYDDQSP